MTYPSTLRDPDRIEKVLLLAVFSYFVVRMVESWVETRTLINLLYLFDQSLVVAFILFRRPAEAISRRPADWVSGLAGTFLPLLLLPASGTPLVPMAACWALMLLGIATHLAAKLTLRRSFGVIAANRGVKLSGPYLLVRHPMYLGYMLSQLGFFLAGPYLANLLIIACLWSLQVGRILAEERILGADAAYVALTRRTRWRLVPGVY
jgi:protein-S-isoprenylcysteine O-methyltransferase Ste14